MQLQVNGNLEMDLTPRYDPGAPAPQRLWGLFLGCWGSLDQKLEGRTGFRVSSGLCSLGLFPDSHLPASVTGRPKQGEGLLLTVPA